MKSNTYNIADLISKFLQNSLSIEEKEELNKWIIEDERNRELINSFKDNHAIHDLEVRKQINSEFAWKRLKKDRKKIQRYRFIKKYASVAAFMLIALTLILRQYDTNLYTKDPKAIQNIYLNDVDPGQIRAQLKLSSGELINLETHNVDIKEQDGTQISNKQGVLSYENKRQNESGIFNTLVIPKAGTYQILLSDGTLVYLNSMSELHFPTHFDKNQRTVFLKGEAYFKVASDSKRPFYVQMENKKITVLGTEFNVNSYSKSSKTTLVEGSVKITTQAGSYTLKPGQELVEGKNTRIQKADLSKNLAWKNGEFNFKSDNFREVMDEISRWYNVEVIYPVNFSENKGFTGSISRKVRLSEVLEIISYVSNENFKLEGNKLTIQQH